MKRVLLISSAIILVFAMLVNSCNIKPKQRTDRLREKEPWVELLRQNMNSQSEWIKVHAAEFLLWSGHADGVKDTFMEEERVYAERFPYRIGIWRVLAQAEADRQKKEVWINKIMSAYKDETGPDRLHAIETLAKLHISPFSDQMQVHDILDTDSIDAFIIYQLWSFAYTSDSACISVKKVLLDITLDSEQPVTVRSVSAFALKKLGALDSSSWSLLAEAALVESDNSLKVNLLNASIVTAPHDMTAMPVYSEVMDNLLRLNEKCGNIQFNISVLDALSVKGTTDDLDWISSLLDKIQPAKDVGSADALSYGAYAVLMINQR